MQTSIIINALEKILNYLTPFLPAANCHMVDFYTRNIYDTHVSNKIRSEILGSESLNPFWNHDNELNSLNSFIKLCHEHTLQSFPDVCLDLNGLEQKLTSQGCKNLYGLHMESFMSFKKSHEVEIMSKIASAISELSETTHIVDIGDGKGYLSSALAMHSRIRVLGVDSSIVNTQGAAKRVAKLTRVLKRTENKNCDNDLYKQTTQFVTETTDLNQLILEHFGDSNCIRLGLIGLHTCGDLASSCLRIFHANPNIRTLCNVGCCYNHLTENNSAGFPMSNFLQQRNFNLGRNARMVAAQALDRMIYEKEQPSDILFYRSLLQVLLTKHAPNLLGLHVGRFKKPTSFTQYIKKSLDKFNCEVVISDNEITEVYDSYLPKKGQLDVFYMLRAHLAPVIEAVILLDRLLYLHELGYNNCYLVRLFDPIISPRCYGIIAFKAKLL